MKWLWNLRKPWIFLLEQCKQVKFQWHKLHCKYLCWKAKNKCIAFSLTWRFSGIYFNYFGQFYIISFVDVKHGFPWLLFLYFFRPPTFIPKGPCEAASVSWSVYQYVNVLVGQLWIFLKNRWKWILQKKYRFRKNAKKLLWKVGWT